MDGASYDRLLPDDSNWVVAAYESIREYLPHATYPDRARPIADLNEIQDDFDVFLFDAFGVLNIGDTAIPGATRRIAALRKAGRRVMLVSNAASLPRALILAKYQRFGFDFSLDEIVTSRDALIDYLTRDSARRWGVVAPPGSDVSDLPGNCQNVNDGSDVLERVDGFILLAAAGWSDAGHRQLLAALQTNPRPILVANPDLVAPREDGLSLEPGHIAHDLRRNAAGVELRCFGKPYPEIFRLAMSRPGAADCPARVLMVGDTLHTDILGGRAAGFNTALVTGAGISRASSIHANIDSTGIVPDFICPAI